MSKTRFPIRLKILVAVLCLVTGVVSAITFTMASLFHDDKKAYIQDLASLVALGTAEETRSVLSAYEERLRMYATIMLAEEVAAENKTELLRKLFQDFPQLVAIELIDDGEELAAIYNTAILEAAGLDRERLKQQRDEEPPPVADVLEGRVFVGNSTLIPELPTLTMALAVSLPGESEPVLAAAVIRLEELQAISGRPNGFEVSLIDSGGRLLVHPERARVAAHEQPTLQPEVETVRNGLSKGLTLEYVDDEPMVGAFAAADLGGVISAARIPLSAAYLASRELLNRLLVVALVLLALSTALGLVWAHQVTRPVVKLAEATKEIAKGRFDIQVHVEARDEIGGLAGSFNQMASGLKQREEALEASQAQLVQSEKMAAFGQLGAGIAHEVKNPLAGILGCAQISLRKAEKDTLVHANLQLIEKETRRCKTIIENLLKFARQEKAVYLPTEVNLVTQDAAQIVNHQLEMHGVKIRLDLEDDLPFVSANHNQLQQVLMNLMINAQQAMGSDGGEIIVTTREVEDQVEIVVQDTGPGMPREVQERAFDPFFTTKPGGKGTGLGLSVSFGIIRDHGGRISVQSAPGEGAAFTIELPASEVPPELVPTPELTQEPIGV